MQVLGMPGSVFKVDLPKKENGVHYNGDESVDFLVRTNMGSDFKALKKVASGGELSRICQTIDCLNNC
jgi:DNA repair protein RecN (Recombination protein N)